MNAMTASVIAATLTTPDDITRPADSFSATADEETEPDAQLQDTVAGAALVPTAATGGSVETADCLANKLTPNDARVMVDLLKLAVAGRVSATAQSVISSSLAAIGMGKDGSKQNMLDEVIAC